MILATPKGNREMFQAAFDSSVPIPRASQAGGNFAYSRRRVGLTDAVGVPAFMRGVRLICDTAAGFPIHLYRGAGKNRVPMDEANQLGLLRAPGGRDFTPQQIWSYTFASMIRGGAYLIKVKDSSGNVKQLLPVDPELVSPKYKDGILTFHIRNRPNGKVVAKVGRDTILYVAGILVDHPVIGTSVVSAFRHELGTQLSRQEFEGRYLANDGFPGVVLRHEGNVNKEQRNELRDSFEARHAGAGNAGRPAVLWGGWNIERLSMTMTDAQFIESQRFSVQEVGRMLGIPPGLLNDPDDRGTLSIEQENMRFLQYGLEPWMTRLEQSLATDPDLFAEPDWNVELDSTRLLRADIRSRYDAYRLARQGGWVTANEIRTLEGYAEVEGGDDIQQTPVGGAPNRTGDTTA